MISRRELIASGLAATVSFRDDTLDSLELLLGRYTATADDEDFWGQVQQAFTLDRNIVNLNNGGCSPSPRVVQEAMRRQLELSNQAPSYFMWRHLEPEVENVRRRLAKLFGCDPEEMAITRNASEALETCLFGLDLKAGDEIVTTTLDYPRMITTIQQRERRDGVKMVQVSVPPVPARAQDLVQPIREALTSRTRMILCSHVSFVNGQIFPVRAFVELGREKGIPVIVDGAHAFAQFPFTKDQLACEFYGTSLHKWLMTPIGAGFLYVKKERIAQVWSLMASNKEQSADIRKFEEIGTHPAANHNSIAEALTFNEMIGLERKAARFRYLRERWTRKLQGLSKVRFHTSLKAEDSCAITTVAIDGLASTDLADWLMKHHSIFVTPIDQSGVSGIRVTPNVYTTLEEIDRFAAAMEHAATKGITGT